MGTVLTTPLSEQAPIIHIISVFACSNITLEGTSQRHEVLGLYDVITDGRSCDDEHKVYMQTWPRQDFYLYYLTEVSEKPRREKVYSQKLLHHQRSALTAG